MIEQFRIAFNEDKAILEAIQRKERELRGRRPIRLAIDTGTIRMRQMVENMMKPESASTRASDASAA
jgi:vanillate O-demethylase monooxygenase subunit